MDINKRILDILSEANEPLKPADLALISGLKKEEVDKVITRLKKENKIYSPKRCFYEIRK
jgi:molybdopterin-guanine dinucleotide biosynthesis protein